MGKEVILKLPQHEGEREGERKREREPYKPFVQLPVWKKKQLHLEKDSLYLLRKAQCCIM